MKGWNLRYVKGAPTSENKGSWNSTVTTTKSTTTMTVNSISGGATVFLFTSNGISTLADTKVSTTVPSRRGVSIYASVTYNKHGDSTNYPSGTLDY